LQGLGAASAGAAAAAAGCPFANASRTAHPSPLRNKGSLPSRHRADDEVLGPEAQSDELRRNTTGNMALEYAYRGQAAPGQQSTAQLDKREKKKADRYCK
jgi:hypothetical protein